MRGPVLAMIACSLATQPLASEAHPARVDTVHVTIVPHNVQGPLTRDAIARISIRRSGVLRACYDKQWTRQGSAMRDGSIVVQLTVDMQGGASTTPVRDTIRDPEVAACVERVVGTLHFPQLGSPTTCELAIDFKKP